MMDKTKSFALPVNYFSVALGLLSITLAWRYATPVLNLPAWGGQGLFFLATVVWVFLMSVYLYKWLRYPEVAAAELKDIIQCCFLSLIPITTILMGIALLPVFSGVGHVFIGLGILGQLLFAAYRSGGLWRGTHQMDATTPIIYLPTVAASFASAIAMGALGLPDWGMLFFGAGLFSWLSLEAAILHRLRTGTPLAAPARPIIGIQLAPAFVGCAAYLAVNGGQIDIFVKFLIGYGLLNLLFLSRLFFWTVAHGFTLSMWAYSFGFGSMATVGAKVYHSMMVAGNPEFALLGQVLFWIGSGAIGILILGTAVFLAKKQ